MSGLGFERATQDRVLRLFLEKLHCRYLGDWKERQGNSPIEATILTAYLQRCGYSSAEIPSPATFASTPSWLRSRSAA